MKKFVFGVAAAALLGVAPASAQNYGNDAIAWIDLDASAVSFCALTATEEGNSTPNVDVNDDNTTGAGFHFSDARLSFDLQTFNTDDNNSADETVQSANRIADARAVLRFPRSQCNSNFIVQARSNNGGMKNDDFASFDEHFTDLIGYTVEVEFDDTVDIGPTAAAPGYFIPAQGPYYPEFGLFKITVRVDGDNKRMLVGDYTDFLAVEMIPQV